MANIPSYGGVQLRAAMYTCGGGKPGLGIPWRKSGSSTASVQASRNIENDKLGGGGERGEPCLKKLHTLLIPVGTSFGQWDIRNSIIFVLFQECHQYNEINIHNIVMK